MDTQAPANSLFTTLPFELRLEISSHLSSYNDYSNLRKVDSTNLTILPFYGVRGRFIPTHNELMFVTWFCKQMSVDYAENHLLMAVVLRYHGGFQPLDYPLRYDGMNPEGFATFRMFFEEIRDLAVHPPAPVRAANGGIGMAQFTYDRSVDLLERLRQFRWHPEGNILPEEGRLKLEEWSLAIKARYDIAAKSGNSPGAFNFEETVAEALYRSVIYMHRRYFDGAIDWMDEETIGLEGTNVE